MRIRLLGLLALLLALTAAGCSSAASEPSKGDTLAALAIIDGAGFHNMNEVLTGTSPKIDPAWVGAARRAQIAASVIQWDKDLQPKADEFVKTSKVLIEAIEKDDARAAAKPSMDNHAAYHALSEAAWASLGAGGGSSAHTH